MPTTNRVTRLWTLPAAASLCLLAACALPSQPPPDFAATNRSMEARCFRVQKESSQSISRPGATRAEVQAEAQAAARRGELDKICDSL